MSKPTRRSIIKAMIGLAAVGPFSTLFRDRAEQVEYGDRVKERVEDFIYNISPVETPLASLKRE